MWITFHNIELKNFISKAGKPYEAYIVTGTKSKFGEPNDVPMEKFIFPDDTITLIEKGVVRKNVGLAAFFRKGAKPGDRFDVKTVPDGQYAKWDTIKRLEEKVLPDYEPLTDEKVAQIKTAQENMTAKATETVTPWAD